MLTTCLSPLQMSSHPPKYDTSTEEEEGLLSDDITYPPAAPSFSELAFILFRLCALC